jgi:hypothetical protein
MSSFLIPDQHLTALIREGVLCFGFRIVTQQSVR